jgi:hypothetical protein
MQTQPQPVRAAPKASGTMKLGNLVKGRQKEPWRLLLAGVEGIGKSTFGAAAPKPVFLDAEGGTGHLDVQRFPRPTNLADVHEALRELTDGEHAFETLVVDTVDWLEPLVWQHICQRDNKADIEDYGYGKGYQAALDEWRPLIAALERLEKARGMNIVLLAHTQLKTFKNPQGEDFDRYELKLHQKAGGLLKEWVKAVLFANFEQYAVKAEKDKNNKFARAKGISTGQRLIYTERDAAYDAKNRYALPPQIALNWEAFITAAANGAVELTARIKALAAQIGGQVEKDTLESLARCGEDSVKLAQLPGWISSKSK